METNRNIVQIARIECFMVYLVTLVDNNRASRVHSAINNSNLKCREVVEV